MNDGQLVENYTLPAHWTPELDELDHSLDEPARGVRELEQHVVRITETAAAVGAWAPIFEAWAVLVRRHECVTTGEALTVWASAHRQAVDLGCCRPALDFRAFEADLVLGVWPELRWGEGGSTPGHAPSDCEAAWLGLWQTLWKAAAADLSMRDAEVASTLGDGPLAHLVAFSRLTATVFAPRRGDEALGMPARWRLDLLKQVRAFEAAAAGAPGGEALARPHSGDAAADMAIAAGCCVLFHHARRSLVGNAGHGRAFSAALDDLIAAPLPAAEAPGETWRSGGRRNLERLFRFWAAGDAALKAMLKGLGLHWSVASAALPAPNEPAPQDVVERIALIGGTNVGKTSFLFGSEHLRRDASVVGSQDNRLPIIRHAWMKDPTAAKRVNMQRERWRKGMPSNTERPELVAATGVHSFQAFEIVDMKGEDLLPRGNAVMDYAMRDLFNFRPPAALALMLDTVAPLSSRDLESVKRLLILALKAHEPESNGSVTGPVPPVHLIANKADRFITGLRASLMDVAAKPQEADAELLHALCDKALDLGIIMRRAMAEAQNLGGSILPLLMREALESEVLSESPTLGVAVDHLLENEGALIQALISKGATNVVLNFTCSAAPNGVVGLPFAGIRAFWDEIWGWANERRKQALEVQRSAFVYQPDTNFHTVKALLDCSGLRFDNEQILRLYDDLVVIAEKSAHKLSRKIENDSPPTSAGDFVAWLKEDRNQAITDLGDAVEKAWKAAKEAEDQLNTSVDTIIGHLLTLLGIDPEEAIKELLDRQRHGDVINEAQDWLDQMQATVAGRANARSLPALIASDKLPEPLMQAGLLLKTVKEEQQDAGFRLLKQMVEQQEAAIRATSSMEKALPGGPDSNPRLFHRIHGALLDDCFWKNEPWRKNHWQNNSVALLLAEADLGVKALLVKHARVPDAEGQLDWRHTLAPLLRLLAEYKPKFPQLTMQRFQSDAVKVGVLAQMPTRRRTEKLITALETSLAVRAALTEKPTIAERVRQLIMIEAMLPAVRKLGFDAPSFEALVRHSSAHDRRDAINQNQTNEGALGLLAIQRSVREQLGLWPRSLLRTRRNTAPVMQTIRANIAASRNDLSSRFGSHILPDSNQENIQSLEVAVTRLQVGMLLLQLTAGDARLERTALVAEMRDMCGKITDMHSAVEVAEKAIRTDILVERYRRFLALGLEESALAVASLHDGLDVVDGGIVRAGASLDEIERRYLATMRSYFDERRAS